MNRSVNFKLENMMHGQFAGRRISAISLAVVGTAALLMLLLGGPFASRHSPAAISPALVTLSTSKPGSDAIKVSPALQASARPMHSQPPVDAFSDLNRRAGGSLEALWDAQSGIPRFISANNATARIPYVPTAAERGNPFAIARGFLDENRDLFRLGAVSQEFSLERIEPDKQLGYAHVRLQQQHNGVPVFGRQLVVHLDDREGIVAVSGQYVPDLNVADKATLSKEQAEKLAVENVRHVQLEPAASAKVKAAANPGQTTLMVYVDDKGKGTLTWRVKVSTTTPLGAWLVFVNARRPTIVHAIDNLNHSKDRSTYSAGNGTDIPGKLLAQEGERTSDRIGQAAHDAAGVVYDYYFKTFKRDSIDGHGIPMVSTVHFGTDPEDAENAAWIGEAQQMIYGDGGRIFKPLPYGLDVVGHEFTHGVTDSTSQLTYEGQSGALNESYSDVFGAMIDSANWTIGEAVVKSPPFPVRYLRSLEDPELGGKYDPLHPLAGIGQPGDMSKYANLPLSRRADNGGVHINSGIPSHAAYYLASAIGRDKTQQIYYRTLTQYLSPDSDFADAARATIRAATDLYSTTEANAVRDAFRRVGIDAEASQAGPAPGGSTPVASGTAVEETTPVASGTVLARPSTTPPAAEELPADCRDVIVNGGFEGTKGWKEVSSSNTEIIDPELPHTGSQSAWLGGTDKESVQYIYQDVQIPGNATSVKLSYYRLLHEEFSGPSGALADDANFKVLLADTGGNEIAVIESLSSSAGDDTWNRAQFDISRYAGQTVRLVFAAENPRDNVSSLFVDDITLVACTSGEGPAAPTTSSSDLIYLTGKITNADTGRGVAGAQIFILKPNVTASDVAKRGTVTDADVLTMGTSDSRGIYQTEDPVQRGRSYSAIVLANGYRPIVADDGVKLPSDAENPTQIDATLRPAR